MKGDDGNLRIRVFELGINVITASYIISAIQNSREQKNYILMMELFVLILIHLQS